MKKLFILAAFLFFTGLAFAADPVLKVATAFQKTFPQATGIKWFSTKDGQMAYFDQGNVRYRVTYDAEGNILNSLRYYKAQLLPFLIKAKIEKAYQGKEICGVTEVTVDDETYYHILLRDAKHWLTVHSDTYGNTFVEETYKRSEPGNDWAGK